MLGIMASTHVEGITSAPSSFSVDETLRRLERVVTSRGLTVFSRFDHSDEATRVGMTMQPAHVLVFGNPRGGTPLMVASPLVALELPLRALVWQDGDGQVWVSYADAAFVAGRFGLAPDLAKVVGSVAGIVQAALQDAASTG
jgi:uncharacterized protein (DUF302 family)